MIRRRWKNRTSRTAIAAALAVPLALTTPPAYSQSQPRGNAPPVRRAPQAGTNTPAQRNAQTSEGAGGLNTLTDDALYSELASRGQDSLLDRAFELNKVPESQRAGLRAFGALGELTNKQKPPTPARRQALIAQVVAGAKTVLPSMKDPAKLTETAYLLLTEGAVGPVNSLEFWGENAATQARLRPVMETVLAMYDRAAAEYEAAKADVEKRMTNPNDRAAADRWAKLDGEVNTTLYDRHMADYFLALSVPKSATGMAQRAKIADAAIEYLKEQDAEESDLAPALRPTVRNRIGKLLIAKGDYPAAKETLQTVAANKGFKQAPDLNQQYEARYFSVVADLEAGDTAAARAGLNDLLKWQQQALPNKEDQKGVSAAAEMMQYRIYLADAAKAKAAGNAAEADKANAAAVEVLTKLSNDRPDLRQIISEQLVDRVDTRRGVNNLDPLLLRALVQKGVAEREKGEGEQPDAQVLSRALDAAQELTRRKGAKGVDDSQAEWAALMVPTFLEKLGRKTEAANKYLDFLKAYPRSPQAGPAYVSAGKLIVLDLRQGPNRGDKDVVDVWTRFLPIAINPPYNEVGLAYDYAERLRAQNNFKDAAAYYARVPEADPRYTTSRYMQMVSLYSLLLQQTTAPGGKVQLVVQGDQRAQLAAEVLRQAEQAKKLAQDALAKAKDDAARNRLRLNIAGTTLMTAEVAYLQNDPERTLKALEGLENEAKDLPGGQGMIDRALFLRVNSLMAAGKLDQATRQLLDLLDKSGGKEGQDMVIGLLSRLNEEFDKAQVAGDEQAMARLAQSRASLSGSLVQWARNNKNPDVRKRLFSYSLYDADSKRLAGMLAKDEKQLREALEAFRKLQTPEMVSLYRAESAENTKADPNADPNAPHPNVLLGIGLTSFDLHDYKTAQQTLGPLVFGKRLGGPQLEKVDEKTGETSYVDNDPYWEATYKLLRSNVELYKQNKNDPGAVEAYEGTKGYLKRSYVRGNVGGKKWNRQFEALRQEIIPEFDPKSVAPATQPGGGDAPGAPRGEPAKPQAAGPVAVDGAANGAAGGK
jgi:hypothetical protein